MIAGKYRDRDAIEFRNFVALPARQPYCQFFETAKASRRFCQRLLSESGGVGGTRIAFRQVATERFDIV
jgi:hypothetical protein